jgi:hypothetical protein
MAIRKFTPTEYKALLDFCVATDECRSLQFAAQTLYHHRNDLPEHLLEFAFLDAANALNHMNRAFNAVKPIFNAEQEEAA